MVLSRPVIAIVGPTASGKSALGIRLASEMNGEIVSADSMQIYKGMDIGTAKVPPADRVVKHHGIDLIDPGEPYSAALFQQYARNAFEAIDSSGSQPFLVGGTGFYIRAALDDYDFVEGEQVGNEVRDKYSAIAEEHGAMHVWNILNDLDPNSAAEIHPNNTKRVIRALEMNAAGESYSEQLRNLDGIKQIIPAVMIGIDVDRDRLYGRINARVGEMREEGLVEEVESLISAGFKDAVTAQQAIGYKEIASALDGECTMDEAFDAIRQATRRYAKRQLTWFRRDKRICWINGNSGNVENMAQQARDILSRNGF